MVARENATTHTGCHKVLGAHISFWGVIHSLSTHTPLSLPHIHTHTYTKFTKHAHTHTHTKFTTYAQTHTHSLILSHSLTHTHTHTHTHTLTCTHTYTHAHTHSLTHTYTHMHTYIHTHTYTHKQHAKMNVIEKDGGKIKSRMQASPGWGQQMWAGGDKKHSQSTTTGLEAHKMPPARKTHRKGTTRTHTQIHRETQVHTAWGGIIHTETHADEQRKHAFPTTKTHPCLKKSCKKLHTK